MAQPGVVAPWRAAYVPGDWYVIAGPTSLVVLEPGPGRGDMIADLWADVVASSSMSDLVDRLAGYGITELPDLAVVFWSTAGMRSLVRGKLWLDDPSSGDAVATGDGVVTWNEVGLEHVETVRIRMREQPADGEALPVAVGVVRAGAVSLSADEAAVVRSPQPLLRSAAGAAPFGSRDAPSSADATAMSQEPPVDGDLGEQPPTQPDTGADNADGAGGANGSGDASEEPDQATSHAYETADDDSGPDFPPITSDDDAPSQTGESPSFGLDSEWGPQPASAAASAAGGAAGGAVGGAVGGLAAGGGMVGAAGSAAPAGSAGAVTGSAGSVASPDEFSLEQFEMENDDTQLMADPVLVGPDTAPADATAVTTTEPLVEAVRCPNGHANAPGSAVCRVCRAPTTGAPAQLIPKPLIARLRAADGTVVDLDRAVLLGRAPSEQRSTVPLPRLVTLASPAQDISRTHLQVVPENWLVVVTDLKSTNGTFVIDPGPGGNRGLLSPGQPTPVPIGAVLELGEGVSLTIEPGD